tara:strand:- start:21330 stop:22505 length:1176 start_codon:yes stop_codon:yes gene_type:complete
MISQIKFTSPFFKVNLFVLIGFLVVFQNGLLAQEEQNTGEKVHQEFESKLDNSPTHPNESIQLFPTLFYTPETNFGFGAGGLAIFKTTHGDSVLKNSFVSLSANYTLNKQFLVSIKHEINFHRNYLVRGEFSFYKYPDVYAGYGNNHTGETFELFNATYPRIKLDVLIRSKRTYIYGIRYSYQNTTMKHTEPNGVLENEQPVGYQGSVNSSLGIVLNYDSRNYIYAPTKGWYSEVSLSISDPLIGATFKDQLFLIDIRKYIPLFKKHVVAIQFANEIHFGSPAFNHTAIIGGEYNMRGYRYGIFRDLNSYVVQTEFRSSRFLQYFSAAAFGSIGGVGHDYLDTYKNTRIAYGIGLWVYPQPEKRLFVRFDYGQGYEPKLSHGFYVSMGNAF